MFVYRSMYYKVFCGLCFELIIIIIIIFTYDDSLWILTIVWLLLNDIKAEQNETKHSFLFILYFTLANFWLYVVRLLCDWYFWFKLFYLISGGNWFWKPVSCFSALFCILFFAFRISQFAFRILDFVILFLVWNQFVLSFVYYGIPFMIVNLWMPYDSALYIVHCTYKYA